MKTSAWTLSPETKFSQTRVCKYVTKIEPETFRFRVSVLFFPAVSITWPLSPTLECQAVKRQTGNPYFTLYHPVWSCFCSNFQTKTFLPRSSMCNLFQALHLLSLVFSPRSVCSFSPLTSVSVSIYKWKTMPFKQRTSKKQDSSCPREEIFLSLEALSQSWLLCRRKYFLTFIYVWKHWKISKTIRCIVFWHSETMFCFFQLGICQQWCTHHHLCSNAQPWPILSKLFLADRIKDSPVKSDWKKTAKILS